MRRAIGPIVTTGVAIVVAGVVVANPIVAPHTDVAIPAVKLSGSSDAAGSMLDQAFLDAIAPRPNDSTSPFSVLKQLITSLAADASYIGKNAIVNAFVAGVTAVSEPELTASALPYLSNGVSPTVAPPPPDFGGLAAMAQAAGIDPAAIVNGTIDTVASAINPTHVSTTIGSAVDQLATSIVSDAGYVGHELIAAAFAAGAVVASEPGMIVATLQSLVKGDISGALQNALAAATAPLQPTGIVINAFLNVVQSHLAEITGGMPTISIPSFGNPATSPVSSLPVSALASPPASVTAPAVVDRGMRSTTTAAPVAETDTADAPPPITALRPAASTDLGAIARGVAGQTGESTAADTPAAEPSAATTTPAPRAVARDAKSSRDTARGTAGRGVRGASTD